MASLRVGLNRLRNSSGRAIVGRKIPKATGLFRSAESMIRIRRVTRNARDQRSTASIISLSGRALHLRRHRASVQRPANARTPSVTAPAVQMRRKANIVMEVAGEGRSRELVSGFGFASKALAGR